MKNLLKSRCGFTLVELLVVISILTIITALLVPRLRIVNKDRNIRETGRIVGSMFSTARDRAVADGRAGVIIERNLNFLFTTAAGNRVYFAGSRLHQMRAIPDFIGDSGTDFAFAINTSDSNGNPTVQCLIPFPLEHDPAAGRSLFRQGDRIQFGKGRPFQINEVLPGRSVSFDFDTGVNMVCGKTISGSSLFMLPMNIAFDNNNVIGDPLNTNATDYVNNGLAPKTTPLPTSGINGNYKISTMQCEMDFSIQRLRKTETSSIDLPAGYLVDLRFSGPTDSGEFENAAIGADDLETSTVFGLGLTPTDDAESLDNREIQVQFDNKGSIDQIVFNGNTRLAGKSLFLFVNEFDPSEIGINDSAIQIAEKLLSNPASLWITVGFNGGINIGYNAPPPSDTAEIMISNARTLSRSRTSANQ